MSQQRIARNQQLPRLFRRQNNCAAAHREYESVLSTENVLANVKAGDEPPPPTCLGHEALDEVLMALQNSAANQNDKILQQQIHRNKTKTIEDIKRWLQNTSESTSFTGINMRDNSRSSVERYLSEQLSEVLFDKDSLTADIDGKTTKSNIYYDAFNEFQNDKFPIVCEKDDDFILSDLQLENLEQLISAKDDMILNCETVQSTSIQSPYNAVNVNTKDLIIRLQETIDRISNNDKIVENLQVQNEMGKEINRNELRDCTSNLETSIHENLYNTCLLTSIQDFSVHNISLDESEIDDPSYCTNFENEFAHTETISKTSNLQSPIQTRSRSNNSRRKNNISSMSTRSVTTKSKFQPSIIKRKRKFLGAEHSYCKEKDVSSFTTNELPKLRNRKNTMTSESSDDEEESDFNVRHPLYYSQQEIVISKALEEVGITDKTLKHDKLADDTKVWQCQQDQCDRQFAKPCSLKAHLLTHFGIKPFKCDYDGCSWAFYTEFKLKRHKETHLKKKDYMCPIPGCKRRFTTVYNLASHEKLHTRPNRIICQVPECTAKFPTKRALEAHMKTHDESLAPYICNFEGCGKRYYGSNALMSHQRCHSYSQLDVTCSWPGCGKTFDQPCRLKAHMRSHTGLKPYTCTFKGCKWAFSTSSKLKRHQKKHTNDRKFVCDVDDCKKAFMRSEHLKEHKLTHVRERFFQCHVCSSAFSAKSSLYVHIKKHSNKDFVSKGHRQQKKKKTVEKKTISKKKDTYCSKVQSIRISAYKINKRLSESEYKETEPKNDTATKENENADTDCSSSINILEDKTVRDMHICPVDSEVQNSNLTHFISSSPFSQEDRVMSNESQCSINKLSDQVIEIPFKSIFLSDQTLESSIEENNKLQTKSQDCLKSQPLKDLISNSTQVQVIRKPIQSNKGSARTAFTCENVLSLKPYKKVMDRSIGANDVVLDATNLDGGLYYTIYPLTFSQRY